VSTVSGRVAGKVALVTGAARGQGRSHAIRLAEEGADLILVDIAAPIASIEASYPPATDEDFATTVAAVRDLGRRVVWHKVDVRDFTALRSAVDDGVTELGGVDIVAANAGIVVYGGTSLTVEDGEWEETIGINLKGVWHTVKAAVPHMIAAGKGGSVVITSSSAGLKGTSNVGVYPATKHAVLGLARTLCNELAPHLIRVNTIHPCTVNTPMAINPATFALFRPDLVRPTMEDVAADFAAINALPVPWVEPRDISNALLFLACDESRFVTGTELKVDAGFTTK
jgi:SDR family mycofactocin-dependent oxidoreductase